MDDARGGANVPVGKRRHILLEKIDQPAFPLKKSQHGKPGGMRFFRWDFRGLLERGRRIEGRDFSRQLSVSDHTESKAKAGEKRGCGSRRRHGKDRTEGSTETQRSGGRKSQQRK